MLENKFFFFFDLRRCVLERMNFFRGVEGFCVVKVLEVIMFFCLRWIVIIVLVFVGYIGRVIRWFYLKMLFVVVIWIYLEVIRR